MELFIAFITAFTLTLVMVPLFIKLFIKKKMGQAIREEGPTWHQAKTGTPTMGGTVFMIVSCLVSLVMAWLFNCLDGKILMLVSAWFLFGTIGFADDFISVFKKTNEGLTAKQKFLIQLIFAGIVMVIGYSLQEEIAIPFGPWQITQFLLVFIFAFFWITGFSNAVNLTDGLDGLATGLSVIAYGAYFMLALREGHRSLALASLVLIACLLGFLVYNRRPAKIFMGDVGSLSLGAGLATLSISLNHPWSLLLIGLVFVLETLSVIIQVTSFKTRGKRVFKMAPVHHHFEMIGWSEEKVVAVFWGLGLLASLLYFVL